MGREDSRVVYETRGFSWGFPSGRKVLTWGKDREGMVGGGGGREFFWGIVPESSINIMLILTTYNHNQWSASESYSHILYSDIEYFEDPLMVNKTIGAPNLRLY